VQLFGAAFVRYWLTHAYIAQLVLMRGGAADLASAAPADADGFVPVELEGRARAAHPGAAGAAAEAAGISEGDVVADGMAALAGTMRMVRDAALETMGRLGDPPAAAAVPAEPVAAVGLGLGRWAAQLVGSLDRADAVVRQVVQVPPWHTPTKAHPDPRCARPPARTHARMRARLGRRQEGPQLRGLCEAHHNAWRDTS
jgi:hypothetical protein